MKITEILRSPLRAADTMFIVLIFCSVMFAVGAVVSGLERREALVHREGGRRVDVEKIRRQISEGSLSPRKALFFKKVPR